jgi:hypothetical protein
MGDYYISNAKFNIRSRLTVTPVCLNIDYNLRQGEARFSSDFGISSNEIIVEAALPTPLQMTADLVCKAIIITPPLHKVLIDFACVGVHWKPDHDYRIVFTEDAIREKGDRPLVGPTFTKTYTSNPLPILSSSNPAFGSTSVINNTKIEFQFDRLMRPGRGNLYLYEQASPSNILIGTYNVNMDVEQTNTDNLTKFTINTLGLLKANKTYVVTSDVKVFRDFDELYYPQLSGTTYTFSTALSTNNQFPDLISFVLSSGTLVSTFKRYRNPGPTTIDAAATLTGPANWRLRRSPSSLSASVDQTVSLKYANATSRPNLSSEFEFVDIFVNYTANGQGNFNSNFNYTSTVGAIKQFLSSVSADLTVSATTFFSRRRNTQFTNSTLFDIANNVSYGMLSTTRAAVTTVQSQAGNILNGPLLIDSRGPTEPENYTLTVVPTNATISFASLKSSYDVITGGRGPEGPRQQTVSSSDGSELGWEVAISRDGLTMIAHCLQYQVSPQRSAIFLYNRSGSTWSGDVFQTGLSFGKLFINKNGTKIANSTKVYDVGGSTHTLPFNIIGMNADGDTICARDTTNNAAKIYKWNGSAWNLEATITQRVANETFAYSASLSDNGNTIAIGAPSSNNSLQGSVYILSRSGTTWTQQAKLQASNGTTGDDIGTRIKLSGDGKTLAATGINTTSSVPSMVIFSSNTGSWAEQFSTTGISPYIDLSTTSDTLVAGYPSGSQSYSRIYTRYNSTWTLKTTLNYDGGSPINRYGVGVAISGDATQIAVGAPNDLEGKGSIYTYTGPGAIFNYDNNNTFTIRGNKNVIQTATDNISMTFNGSNTPVILQYTATRPSDGFVSIRSQNVNR